ncbi:MAG: ABC transporter permease, partial [Oscillospiraceae bacterium]
MKFFKLLKKEIRDIMTLDSLIGIIVGLVIFLILGNVMGTVTEELTKKVEKVAICDLDKSKATEQFFSYLQSKGVEVVNIQEGTHVKMLEEAEKSADISTVMVIKKGFQDEFLKGAPPTLEKITRLKSFATLSDNDVTAKALQSHLDDYFEITLDKMVEGTTVGFLKNPYKVTEVTVVGQKSEYADSGILKAFGMQQSIFIPIIVFMLITTATQLNCSSIANEKTDKTLETLLSTPISRISVLAAKMTASAVYSLLMAGVF